MIRLVLVFAIFATVASAAIGSTLMQSSTVGQSVERQMVADNYANGGSQWTILSGVTTIEKSGGCGSNATMEAAYVQPADPADQDAAPKKSDRLPTLACTMVAAN